jgi:hypothetical protein
VGEDKPSGATASGGKIVPTSLKPVVADPIAAALNSTWLLEHAPRQTTSICPDPFTEASGVSENGWHSGVAAAGVAMVSPASTVRAVSPIGLIVV